MAKNKSLKRKTAFVKQKQNEVVKDESADESASEQEVNIWQIRFECFLKQLFFSKCQSFKQELTLNGVNNENNDDSSDSEVENGDDDQSSDDELSFESDDEGNYQQNLNKKQLALKGEFFSINIQKSAVVLTGEKNIFDRKKWFDLQFVHYYSARFRRRGVG